MENYKKQFAITALRRASMRWRPRGEAIKAARVIQLRVKGRLVWHYKCTMCPEDKLYTQKQIQLDHKVAVVDVNTGWTNFEDFIDRLFCEVDNFQILCKPCHKLKSKGETAIRTISRQNSKKLK